MGIVPCKVTALNGAIKRGRFAGVFPTPRIRDEGTDRRRMLGAVVGKALERLAEGRGMIRVLVTLR
jgi:hypothetical protein